MRIDEATQAKLRRWFPDLEMQNVRLVQGGPFCWLVAHFLHQGAMTVSPFVFYGTDRFVPASNDSVALLAHELKHVQQYHERGHLRFLARYFIDKAHNGWRYSKTLPLEKEAYDLQDEVLEALRNSN